MQFFLFSTVLLWSRLSGLSSEPGRIDSTPLDAAGAPFEQPSVNSLGAVNFAGQEDPAVADAGSAQQTATTPSPYQTVPVVLQYSFAPWQSALDSVKVDVTMNEEVDNQPGLRALRSWLRTQKSYFLFCVFHS